MAGRSGTQLGRYNLTVPGGRDVMFVATIVLVAALVGIATRPLGFVATFWPANALLLGIFLRTPRLASPLGWIAAGLAFVAADLLTGGGLRITIWLTVANVAGVAAGFMAFQAIPPENRRLGRPLSMVSLFAIGMVASAGSTAGSLFVVAEVLDHDWPTAASFWFATELANYLVILPVIVTMPAISTNRTHWRLRRGTFLKDPVRLLPLGALVASNILGILIGGSGAIAFTVPALIWCAVRYGLFPTTLLTMLVGVANMFAISSGALTIVAPASFFNSILSIKLGIAFLALGPLTVASMIDVHRELLATLDHAANHDYLTNALTRKGFMARGRVKLHQLSGKGQSAALLMIDIDHFKRVNDGFGHHSGDEVLAGVAAGLSEGIIDDALFSRFGGEEFVILLPNLSLDESMNTADCLRTRIERIPFRSDAGDHLSINLSIGVTYHPVASPLRLEAMLREADSALYAAKSAGRNRVALAHHEPVPGTIGIDE